MIPLLIGAVLSYVCFGPAVEALPALAMEWMRWAFLTGVGLLPLAVACVISPLHAEKDKHLSSWWVCRSAKHLGMEAIAAPVSITLSAIYSGGAWDLVKAVTGFNP